MSSEHPTPARAGDWEYLIAHHFPNRYNRTLQLRRSGRAYHFCARCTGELIGFGVYIALFLTFPGFASGSSTPLAATLIGIGPIVALIDWLTQTVRARESTNPIRVLSGGLVGAAFGGWVAFGVAQHWTLFALGTLMLGAYLAIAAGVLYWSGAWRKVLAEHFP